MQKVFEEDWARTETGKNAATKEQQTKEPATLAAVAS